MKHKSIVKAAAAIGANAIELGNDEWKVDFPQGALRWHAAGLPENPSVSAISLFREGRCKGYVYIIRDAMRTASMLVHVGRHTLRKDGYFADVRVRLFAVPMPEACFSMMGAHHASGDPLALTFAKQFIDGEMPLGALVDWLREESSAFEAKLQHLAEEDAALAGRQAQEKYLPALRKGPTTVNGWTIRIIPCKGYEVVGKGVFTDLCRAITFCEGGEK